MAQKKRETNKWFAKWAEKQTNTTRIITQGEQRQKANNKQTNKQTTT